MSSSSFLALLEETRNRIYSYCMAINGFTSDYAYCTSPASKSNTTSMAKHPLPFPHSSPASTYNSHMSQSCASQYRRTFVDMANLTIEMTYSLHNMTPIPNMMRRFLHSKPSYIKFNGEAVTDMSIFRRNRPRAIQTTSWGYV